jgi:hypothetical protein
VIFSDANPLAITCNQDIAKDIPTAALCVILPFIFTDSLYSKDFASYN